MINFKQVKDVRIPEGEVLGVYRKVVGEISLGSNMLWRKAPTYPRMFLGVTSSYKIKNKIPSTWADRASQYEYTSILSVDKAGVLYPTHWIHDKTTYGFGDTGKRTKWFKTINNKDQNNFTITGDTSDTYFPSPYDCFVDESCVLSAYRVDNEAEHENFPDTLRYFSDAIWKFSDVSDGEILMKATTGSIRWLGGGPDVNGVAFYYLGVLQDEVVAVPSGSPLLSLSSNTGGQVTATSAKYPKSQYPYVCGCVFLDVSSPSTGITTETTRDNTNNIFTDVIAGNYRYKTESPFRTYKHGGLCFTFTVAR